MKPVVLLLPVLLLLLSSIGRCQEDSPRAAEVKPQPLTPAEQAFAETLTGVQLIGRYTTWDNVDEPQKDTYTLDKVAKLQGDLWMFVARIQYGDHDAKLPLPLSVQWAGDTPVITLDKLPVPGFGTFSARIVIHGDQYAGTWDGGDHGGHMFGRVVPIANSEE